MSEDSAKPSRFRLVAKCTGVLFTETPSTDALKHLFRPPATPIFPPSGPTTGYFNAPSPKKQTSSSLFHPHFLLTLRSARCLPRGAITPKANSLGNPSIMKITCLFILISASILGLVAAENLPKILPSKDVPEVVRTKAAQEAGANKITKYRKLENGNIVADSGNFKNRKLFEYTPTGDYVGYSQPMTETKLPDVIRKRYINTMEKKDCPTCPKVLAAMSTLDSVEKITPAGSSAAFYRCKSSLKRTTTTTDYDESGKVLK